MCGICGIVIPTSLCRRFKNRGFPPLRDTLAHRGPDGFGTYREPKVALGHRRLSIVDVVHGQQPMSSADESLVLIYNGEVFNHPALMAALQQEGVRYHTHCDTETVLHVFER